MKEMDKHCVLGVLDSEIKRAGLWDFWTKIDIDEKLQIIQGMFGIVVSTIKLRSLIEAK